MTHEQLNVLVIDDDPAMRRLLAEIVRAEEHQAVPAGSAEEGLGLLPVWTFHVAFLDQNLPGMEGLLLGEYLRANNPEMTVALITGEPDARLQRRSEDLAIQFIEKPFEVGQVLAVLDRHVSEARRRAERRLRHEDPDFAPPISRFADALSEGYAMPGVPDRIERRLLDRVRSRLNPLRPPGQYTERDRVLALGGLMAARVLGLQLARGPSGRTLYEEYDALMRRQGRRTEFE